MKKLLKSEVCGSVNSAPKKKLKHGAWKRRLQNVVSKRAISQNKDSSLSPKEHPYSLKIKAHLLENTDFKTLYPNGQLAKIKIYL